MYEKQDIGGYEIHATLYNTFILSRRDICVNLALFNKQGNVTYFAHHLLVAKKYLHFKQSVDVIIPIQTNKEADHFEIAISKYRM